MAEAMLNRFRFNGLIVPPELAVGKVVMRLETVG